jgi:hypothetical protein
MNPIWQFWRSFGGGSRKALRFPSAPVPEWNDSFPFRESGPIAVKLAFGTRKKGPSSFTRRALLQTIRQIQFTNNSEAQTLGLRRGRLLRCVARHQAPWRLVFATGAPGRNPLFRKPSMASVGAHTYTRGDCSQLAPAAKPCRWFTVRIRGSALPCLARCPR